MSPGCTAVTVTESSRALGDDACVWSEGPVARVYLDSASTSPPSRRWSRPSWPGWTPPTQAGSETDGPGRPEHPIPRRQPARHPARQVDLTSGGAEAITRRLRGHRRPPHRSGGAGQRRALRSWRRVRPHVVSPRSAWTGWATSKPPNCWRPPAPTPPWSIASGATTRWPRCSPSPRWPRRMPQRGIMLHVDAARGRTRTDAEVQRARSQPAVRVRPQTGRPEGGAAALLVRGACVFRRCFSAGKRAPAWRTWSASARPPGFSTVEPWPPNPCGPGPRPTVSLEAASAIPGVRPYGDGVERPPHLICLGVDGVEAEAVLLGLDQAGVTAPLRQRLPVGVARAVPRTGRHGRSAGRSLRLSVGWSTTEPSVQRACTPYPGDRTAAPLGADT